MRSGVDKTCKARMCAGWSAPKAAKRTSPSHPLQLGQHAPAGAVVPPAPHALEDAAPEQRAQHTQHRHRKPVHTALAVAACATGRPAERHTRPVSSIAVHQTQPPAARASPLGRPPARPRPTSTTARFTAAS